MEIKKRYDWVDSLKFIGIFAIYIGHLGGDAGKLYPFVFNYHVPLFFFAAGFFSNHNKSTTAIKFILSKFKRLMLPYFSFAFIILLQNSINAGATIQSLLEPIGSIIYGVRNNPYVGTIWFINCLFVMMILDYAFSMVTKNNIILLALSILSFVATQTILPHNPLTSPSWFLNIDSALAYWWLLASGRVLFGIICNSNYFKYTLKGFVLFFALSIITLYQLMNSQPLVIAIANHTFPALLTLPLAGVFISIFNTTSLILFNVVIAKALSKNSYINKAGANTLNICGLENVTKLIIPSFLALFGLNLNIHSVVAAIIYTILCVVVSNIIGFWLSTYIKGPFKIKL